MKIIDGHVYQVLATTKADKARTPLEVVFIHCDLGQYAWGTEPGAFTTGQFVRLQLNDRNGLAKVTLAAGHG